MIFSRSNCTFFLLWLLCLSYASSEKIIEIAINDGSVAGIIKFSSNGREFYSFQGIPFAQPPLGELRFKSPIPVSPWEGVLDATKPQDVCLQIESSEVIGSEDCLFLNVYTPKLPEKKVNNKLLPVMVYIYGGGFSAGSANLDPRRLLDEDIIVVIPSYRLGFLGFLSTEDDNSPGNYALKDQSLALRWVNENIHHFGGNSKEVTIMGGSAGGVSAHLHIFSPLSKGLFKRGVSMSGTAFQTWGVAARGENLRKSKKLAEKLKCPTDKTKDLVDCLRRIDASDIIKGIKDFLEWEDTPRVITKPAVEPFSAEAFLTEFPANLFQQGKFQDVPWMFGLNAAEGIIQSAGFVRKPNLFQELSQNFNGIMESMTKYSDHFENSNDLIQQLKTFYFAGRKDLNFENDYKNLIALFSDVFFLKGIDEAVQAHFKYSKNPIYYYKLSYEGSVSLSSIFGSPRIDGVCHGDEILYLFYHQYEKTFGNSMSRSDEGMSKYFVTLITNYATYGDPTPEKTGSVWKPLQTSEFEYFNINGTSSRMEKRNFEERIEFLRSLTFIPKKSKNNKEEL